MRIVLDLQGAQTESRYRGIGRYTLSLAKAIARNRGEHEVFLVLNGLFQDSIRFIRSEFTGLLPSENIHVWHAIGPVNDSDANNQWRRESAELLREAFIQSLAPDVVHIPSFFEGYIDNAVTSIGLFDTRTPVSVTMLDLIPLLNPEQYLESNPSYKTHYLRKVEQLKSADKLFAISESARQEALQNLPFSSQDVVHQSIAIEPFFKNLNICKNEHYIRRLALGISKPFVLYTGGADSRKNLPALIQAYASLPTKLRKQHQLVFAGRIPDGNLGELRHIAEQQGLTQDELYFTGYISDRELVELYNLCELFVFPSWHEGFGLPVLEAMACGAPAIAANTSSLPEVIGITDALFCPFSIFDMSNKIHLALTSPAYKKLLKKNSLKQVKSFSWDTVAKNSIASFVEMQKECPLPIPIPKERIYNDVLERLESIYPADISTEDRMEIEQIANTIKSKPDSKTLFIDISELFQRDAATGIQRVTRSLLLELLKHPIENHTTQPIYATADRPGYYYANSYIRNHKLSDLELYNKPDDIVEHCSGDIFLGLDLQHQVIIAQQPLLRKMRNDGVYISFIVYDLLPILMPHTFPIEVEDIHKQWLTILADMDHLLCISNTVANELSDWLRSQEHTFKSHAKISWFHLGADIENSSPSSGLPTQAEQILAQFSAEPSFLCVGTLEPRKGQSQVLGAFEILWEQGHAANLILVGKQGWHVDDLLERIHNHPELNKRLFWFNSISDEFLQRIYSNASCLIAASEGEGFGLPIIEAMKYNLPIIARDIPVFREVAGDKANYFMGATAQSLAKNLHEFISLDINSKNQIFYDGAWLTWFESAEKIKKILTNKKNKQKKIKIVKEPFSAVFKKIRKNPDTNIVDINFSLVKKNKKIIKKIKNLKKSKKHLSTSIANILNDRKNIVTHFTSDLREQHKNIEQIIFEKSELENEIIDLVNSNSSQLQIEKNNTIRIDELEQTIEALKEDLFDGQEATLEHKENIDFLNNTIINKDTEIDNAYAIVQDLERKTYSNHEVINKQNNTIATLQEKLQTISFENSELTSDTLHCKAIITAQQQQIDALKASASWRITYPLRLLAEFSRWIILLPVKLARLIARSILKTAISVVFKISPLRSFLSRRLKASPSLYGHLKRFSIHRNIYLKKSSDIENNSKNDPVAIQTLTPHAQKIYIALKNAKIDNKE